LVEGLPASSSAASSSGDIALKPTAKVHADKKTATTPRGTVGAQISQAKSDAAWAKLHAIREKRKAAADTVAEEVQDLTEDDVYVGEAASSSLDRMD
jgi:hypothetical protein